MRLEGHLQLPARFSLAAWVEEENARGHFCVCGCGQRIVIEPDHRKDGIPKYVPEHRPSRFGAEIRALHEQGLMTVQDVARALRLRRISVLPLAAEVLGDKEPRFGIHCSRKIRVFTRAEVAKMKVALEKKADPRHDLTDAQWRKVAPIVLKTRSDRWNDRAVLNAILWVQRTGARWDALPARYPRLKTCRNKFWDWRQDGRWARVCKVLT